MRSWKTLSRHTILDHSRFLRVESHSILLPDGTHIDDWPWIITPDFVTVIVVNTQGNFVLFRQTKYSVEGVSLAPAGGYIEPGEDPQVAAQRELSEELGYTAASWVHLGSYPVDGNRGAGTAHIYLAMDALKVPQEAGSAESDDLEEQEVIILSKGEVVKALADKAFKVLPWAAGIALALQYLESYTTHAL